ncbi:MAG: hypothetical protein QNJ44_20580 [Rhodobacter sp.]|nr:hypothetical protein [Rhodobacter sp.]
MADLDTGHIFLTTLAPIKSSLEGGREHTSFEQNVRVALAELPTAIQSPATRKTGINSPFARNKRNHLARMLVLNDVVYNGRVGKNALVATVEGVDPIQPQPVDRLNCAYLVFCADIDAVTEDGAPLPTNLSPSKQKAVRAAYARELWATMGPELNDIYKNCVGFDGVKTADDFAAYLDKCHVETTMPFHDYYLKLPKFHTLPATQLILAVAAPAIVALIALLLRILGYLTVPLLGWNSLWTFVIALILTAIVALVSIRYAIRNGEKPLAPGEYDDLPSVLKALYIQQSFAPFVVENQGLSAEELHANFGAFLERHKPSDTSGPTQEPGVISSAAMDQPA